MQHTEPVVIRKYANRRLYDTSSRRYINLDEIAELIRQGRSVQVVDAKTGEDLTRVILTQIIMEDARDQPTGLPLELLRQLIVASDRTGREFIMWYLKSAFDAYHRVQETALSPFRAVKNLFAGPEESELEELRRRVAEMEVRLGKRSPSTK
jgi:polyhydroxyalkanoate synthesis repressor PhaR